MSSSFFLKAVAPLFLVAHTALLCITTPSDNPNSQYSELFKVKDKFGNPPFRHYEYAFVCPKCSANKYDKTGAELDGDERLARMLKCPHKDHRLPRWHSPEKHRIVRLVMEHGSPQDMLREQMGVITMGNTGVFSRQRIDDMMRQPTTPLPTTWDIPYVYMCMDPNTGSHDTNATPGSDFALVSGYDIPNGGGFVITGMEAIDAHEPDDYMHVVVAHAQRLRVHPCTRTATLVIIAENNLGMEAGHLKRELDRNYVRNVVFMQDKDLKSGVRTDHHIKQQMMVLTRQMLMRPSIAFCATFQCLGKLGRIGRDFQAGDPENIPRIKTMLAEQLRAYSEVKIPAHRPEDPVRVKWTGKTSHGMHDDLCVALQLLLYWKNVFHQNPEYRAFWR